MPTEKSPAFQLYVNEFRSSRSVQRMTFAERGMYLEMLMEQWQSFTLPDDADAVAALISTTDGQHAEVVAAWPVLRRKFVVVERQPGRIVNAKLERVRRDRRKFLNDRRKAGREGGLASGRRRQETKELTSKQNEAQLEHSSIAAVAEGTSSSSSSSSSASSSSSSSSAASLALRGRGQPPLSMGLRRLKVWRWMIDEFMDALGAHADDFDIEGWLQDLDRRETRVVAEAWPWLKDELIAEARRRGLPIAVAPAQALGKQTTRLAAAVANIRAEGA